MPPQSKKTPANSANANQLRCPNCGRRSSVRQVGDICTCTKCGAMFDTAPDEGGTHCTNPAGRMMREEGEIERRRERAERGVNQPNNLLSRNLPGNSGRSGGHRGRRSS